MTHIPTLTTQRLNLRQFQDEEERDLYQILQNPNALLYFPSSIPPSLPQVQKLVENQKVHWDEHAYGWWALALRNSNELIGWCGLNYLPETDEVELKYLLAEDQWGKGLATEASFASLQYGFSQTDIEQVVGVVHPENLASQRVLQKAGLSFLGEAVYFGMQCYRYAIDRASYQKRVSIDPDSNQQEEAPRSSTAQSNG